MKGQKYFKISLILIAFVLMAFGSITTMGKQQQTEDNTTWLETQYEDAKFTYGTIDYKNPDGTRTVTLFSGTQFGYEDGHWKELKDLKSFVNTTNIECIVESDGIHKAECIDFNLTHRLIKLDPKIKGNIPVKILQRNETGFIEKSKVNINFNLLKPTETRWIQADFGDVIEFGESSTTVILQTAETENLEDAYVRDNSYRFASIIKYNISSIPSGQQIENVIFYAYVTGKTTWDGDLTYYRITSQTWAETDSASTLFGLSKDTTNSSTTFNANVGAWASLNVTEIIKNDYNSGNKNSSFWMEDPDSIPTSGASSSGSATYMAIGAEIDLATKEYSTASQRPYLNITYSPAGDTIKKYLSNITITGYDGTDYRNYSDTTNTEETSTTGIKYGKTVGAYYVDYGATGSTAKGDTWSSTPVGYGWITDQALVGTIPAGQWTFRTKWQSTTNDVGNPVYVVFKRCGTTNTLLFRANDPTDVLTLSAIITEINSLQSAFDVDGCRLKVEYWINVTAVPADSATAKVWFDLYGANEFIIFPYPSKVAYYNPQTNNSYPRPGDSINFTTNFTVTSSNNVVNLSQYIFENNISGVWTNTTYSFPAGIKSAIATHVASTNTPGVYGWRFYANDTQNNTNQTPLQTVTVATRTLVVTWQDGSQINSTTCQAGSPCQYYQYDTFNASANVTCVTNPSGQSCGSITGGIMYNDTATTYLFVNTTNDSTPFYVIGSSTTTQISCSNLTNVGDTYIFDSSPDSNYGTLNTIRIYSWTSNNIKGWLKFNTFLGNGHTVNYVINATLYLYYYLHGSQDPVGRIRNLYNTSDRYLIDTNPWEENILTWNNQTSADTLQSSQTVPASYQWMNWTINNQAMNTSFSNNKNISLMIKDSVDNSTTTYYTDFYSKEEATQTTLRPYLTVCYNETVTTGPQNPQSIGTLTHTQSYLLNYTINTSGSPTQDFKFIYNFTSDLSAVSKNYTDEAYIRIITAGDTIKPTITNPTVNATSVTQNGNIKINVSVTDNTAVDKVFFFTQPWGNLSTLKNGNEYYINCTSTSTGCNTSVVGTYNITIIWGNDTSNNVNSTSSAPLPLQFNVTVPPPPPSQLLNISASSPSNASYNENSSIYAQYLISYVNITVDKCWYKLDSGSNTTMSNCANTTISVTLGSHTLILAVNGTNSTETEFRNQTSISFTIIDTIAPRVNLDNPANNTYNLPSANNTYCQDIRGTLWDTIGLDICNREVNGTNTTVGCGSMNTTVCFGLGTHYAKFWANDTSGNLNSSGVFFTIADVTAPSYSLNSTSGTQAGTSVTHSLFWNDSVGLDGYIFSFSNCTSETTAGTTEQNDSSLIQANNPDTGPWFPNLRTLCRDGDGNLHAVWQETEVTIAYGNSTNGVTWSVSNTKVNNSATKAHPSIDCDGSNIAVGYSGSVMLSTDAGGIFTDVSPPDEIVIETTLTYSQVAIRGNYIYFMNQMNFTRSTNLGQNWASPSQTITDVGFYPSMGVVGTGSDMDKIYVSFKLTAQNDVVVSNSTDGGQAWTKDTVVFDDWKYGINHHSLTVDGSNIYIGIDDTATGGGNVSVVNSSDSSAHWSNWTNLHNTVDAKDVSITTDNNSMPMVWYWSTSGIHYNKFDGTAWGNMVTHNVSVKMVNTKYLYGSNKVEFMAYTPSGVNITYGYLQFTSTNTTNVVFVNDSFVKFTSLNTDWSNVTKTINSTVGCEIRWKVHANDTSNNWNTSQVFAYNTTAPPDDTTFQISMPTNYASFTSITSTDEANPTAISNIIFNVTSLPVNMKEPHILGLPANTQAGPTQPIYRIDPSGNVNMNFSIKLSANFPSGFTIMVNSTCEGTCTPQAQNPSVFTTSYFTFATGVATTGFVNVTLYANATQSTAPNPGATNSSSIQIWGFKT